VNAHPVTDKGFLVRLLQLAPRKPHPVLLEYIKKQVEG